MRTSRSTPGRHRPNISGSSSGTTSSSQTTRTGLLFLLLLILLAFALSMNLWYGIRLLHWHTTTSISIVTTSSSDSGSSSRQGEAPLLEEPSSKNHKNHPDPLPHASTAPKLRFPEAWKKVDAQIIHILQNNMQVRLNNLQLDTIRKLPSYHRLTQLYGNETIIYNEESCSTYRQRVPYEQRYAGVAGMFNTGTNLLDFLLKDNLQMIDTHDNLNYVSRAMVPWGKHRNPQLRGVYWAPEFENDDPYSVLPVVMIRDPYQFLQSLCAHPYGAQWRHRDFHCPNLVANEMDRKTFKNLRPTFVLKIKHDTFRNYTQIDEYPSMVHVWNEWYENWFAVGDSFPFLIIRYEDLLLRTPEVLERIARCMGGQLKHGDTIRFRKHTAKSHGSGTDVVQAVLKTGNLKRRYQNMTAEDHEFAAQHLNSTLLRIFHYKLYDEVKESSSDE